MTTKLPVKRVRGSSTGRPIMVALDLLGRRGALRILWELRGEPLTFRALQDAAQAQPGLLNTRLAELREAGIVTHDDGYCLSEAGRALLAAMLPLNAWAERWLGPKAGKPHRLLGDRARDA